MNELTTEERDLLDSALKRYAHELRRSAQSERKFDDGQGVRNAAYLEKRADETDQLRVKLLGGV
ncbi:MAG TPA: hypothetical protein VIG47_16865 [Gemmatimonadaceae bacterium]|jgi:hypothetical protein